MRTNRFLNIKELCVFSLLSAILFCSYYVMQPVPYAELVSTLIIVYTFVYRAKALIPIYIYVFLNGLIYGFPIWWIPYLYIWAVLWGMVMLIPKKLKYKYSIPLLIIISGVFGILYGIFYAPTQALFYNYSFEAAVSWILAGFFSFDIPHAIANVCLGVMFFFPLIMLLVKLNKKYFFKF